MLKEVAFNQSDSIVLCPGLGFLFPLHFNRPRKQSIKPGSNWFVYRQVFQLNKKN